MSASGSSKQCPQCGAALLDEMPFCRTCGWHIASSDTENAPSNAPASEFIPYGMPTGPDSWSPDQPEFTAHQQFTYPSQNQVGYPPPAPPNWSPMPPGMYPYQGPIGPAGYAPAPPTLPPARRARALLLIALIVVLVGGAAGGIFLALHGTSSSHPPVLDRHGLQNNVPLPDNIAFQYKHTVTQGNLTADEWIWKVSKGEPTNIQQFYQDHLPKYGWTHVQALQGNQTLGVVGCQGAQVLIVGVSKHLQDSNSQGTPTTTDAPTGGSALGIALTSNITLKQNFCGALPAPQP